MPRDIMSELKQQTKQHHDQIENNPHSVKLMQDTVSLADYQFILEKFFGFYAPLEVTIQTTIEAQPTGIMPAFELTPRLKTAQLIQDLQALGKTEADLQVLPRCPDLPVVEDVSQVFGCLYVLEGATLGGQLISRHLKRQLDIAADTGGAFFNSYGSQVGPMWQLFRVALTAYATSLDQAETTRIIDVARQTFIKFDRWLLV